MKGFEPMTMTYISLAVVLILVSFAISPLYASIQAATKNNARLSAMEIAGVINTMKSSPSENIVYKLGLPSKCIIDIFDGFVKVSTEDTQYIADFIQTPVAVSPQPGIDCAQKSITLEKKGSRIEVR